MIALDRTVLRRLAEWDPEGVPITSVYLTVDGRRYPRKADYEVRLEELLRRAKAQAEGLGREALRSVVCDIETIGAHVREEFERGDTRGLAIFSSHDAGLWEDVRVPRPVRDRVVVAPTADVLPLEHVLETHPTVCVALVDYEKARLFVAELGRIQELFDIWDEVPGRHDQGGWAQMRMQRHVDDHRHRHLRNVAEALFRLWKRRPFDHLILAGPAEAHVELEHELHAYLRRLVRARIAMPVVASSEEVLRRSLEVEEELERRLQAERIERLTNAAASGRGAVLGLAPTLEALGDGRVAELLVWLECSSPGGRCPSCGRLEEHDGSCPRCGVRLEPVPDVVEAAVASALRQGCRVETVVVDGLAASGGIGGFLRY
ncbi:MAG TPA: Vms1/Ankzf1 family peptidyl-tRNA hydrolase [Actinomycetota bacterium]|nr:Vms1/Ankzf1 family peptidyl-tRNA hydrolase [Actinomycetota bacterium]